MSWTLPVKWLSFDPSREAESIFSAAKNILYSDALPRLLHTWASLRDYNWSAIAGNQKVWTWMIWIALGNGWRCTMGWNGLARRSSLSLGTIHRVSLIYSIASEEDGPGQLEILQGGFFIWPTPYSIPKRKMTNSQPEASLAFFGPASLVGCNSLFFLVLKMSLAS